MICEKSWLQFISKVELKLCFAEDEVMLCCNKLDYIFFAVKHDNLLRNESLFFEDMWCKNVGCEG